MPHPVWIVVANGSRARLLQRDRPGDALFEVMNWVHPQTRQHLSPAAGQHRNSGIRGRSGMARRQVTKDHERAQFAQDICHWLDSALGRQRIGAIAFFASNPFLGDLVAHGHGPLRQQLCGSHALDLTSLALPDLDQRMRSNYQL